MQSTLFAPPRRPVMRYHGGKFRIRNWVIAEFPEHDIYVEPFGGAASCLFAKPRVHCEVYNDLDSQIVNVFRVLRDNRRARRLRRLLDLTPYSRQEFTDSYEETSDVVENARRTILRWFFGFSSASATKGHKTGFRPNSPRSRVTSAQDWASYTDQVQSFTTRLRGVCIEATNAVDVIRQYDSPSTLFYVDPPYPMGTRYEGAGSHSCYRHDATSADHRFIAALLHSIKGMAIVSSYPSQEYDQLYAGFRRLEKRSQASSQKSSSPRVEVLFISPAADARRDMR
jgi:DNA adenine methylase